MASKDSSLKESGVLFVSGPGLTDSPLCRSGVPAPRSVVLSFSRYLFSTRRKRQVAEAAHGSSSPRFPFRVPHRSPLFVPQTRRNLVLYRRLTYAPTLKFEAPSLFCLAERCLLKMPPPTFKVFGKACRE